MAKDLSPATVARVNALVQGLVRQAESDFDISEATKRAATLRSVERGLEMVEVIDAGGSVPGWTREELIVAIDAKLPKNSAPFYLHAAHERHVHRIRARENSGNDRPGATMVVLPAPSVRVPSRELPPPDEDDDE